MKPETPSQQFTPEKAPIRPESTIEYSPNTNNPEQDLKNSGERYEQKAEASAILADVNMTTAIPAPVIGNSDVAQNTTTVDAPLIAKDDDLIENEWIKKAKKIVTETQDDPHKQEEAVSKLQVDYLKKRFGRELGVAE